MSTSISINSKMKSVNNKIQVLMAKYIENKTSNEESMVVLKALSTSARSEME